MDSNIKNYIIGILAIALVVVALFAFNNKDNKNAQGDYSHVQSFDDCVAAGLPVMESFPEQCRTPDGRTFTADTAENAEVVVETPEYGATVTSPLRVTGKAKGTWFFEANIPVTLKDTNGKILAQVGAQAQGEWMTEDYVDFTVDLTFPTPETEFGVLLIQKDNPSGLPENDAEFAVPIRFR